MNKIKAKELIVGLMQGGLSAIDETPNLSREEIATAHSNLSKIGEVMANEAMQMDSAFDIDRDEIIANTIVSALSKSQLNKQNIANALIHASQIDMDSALKAGGAELATQLTVQIQLFANDTVPYVGQVSGINLNGRQADVYEVNTAIAKVDKGFGSIESDAGLNATNFGKTFASFKRTNKQLYVAGTKTYTFNVKALKTDKKNTSLEKGKSYVRVGGIELNDTAVQSSQSTYKSTAKIGDVDVEATFDYKAGTIVCKVTSTEELEAGTILFFSTQIDFKANSDKVGVIGVDIETNKYVAFASKTVASISEKDKRDILRNVIGGERVVTLSLTTAIAKMKAEMEYDAILLADSVAKKSKRPTIDLTGLNQTETSEHSAKRVMPYLEAVVNEIQTEIQDSSKGVIIEGGSGLIEVFAQISRTAVKTDKNMYRRLGAYKGISFYFDPTFDERYPITKADGSEATTDSEKVLHTFKVVAIASQNEEQVVIQALSTPLKLTPLGKTVANNDETLVEQEAVSDINKSKKNAHRVRTITYKLA